MGLGKLWNDATGVTAGRDAAKVQREAIKSSEALQREQFDESKRIQEPWRQAGITALGQMATFNQDNPDSMTDSQGRTLKGFDTALPNQQYQDPGAYKDPTFNFQADPGYAWRQQQQQQGMERSAAARGGLFSGGTVADLMARSGDLASQEYGNAYNRFSNDRNFGRGSYENDRNFGYTKYLGDIDRAMNDRSFRYNVFSDSRQNRNQTIQDRFNRLATLAGYGSGATNMLSNQGQQFGQNMGDLAIQQGNVGANQRMQQYNSQAAFLQGAGNLAFKAAPMFMGLPPGSFGSNPFGNPNGQAPQANV